jgi:hypothetical protein
LVSNESGTIKCRIPENCVERNNYRARIESEEMQQIGTDNGYDFTIYPKPEKPEITLSGDTLLSSTEVGNHWFYGNLPIDGALENELIPEKDGFYKVIVISEHGCISDTSDAFEYIKEIESVEENAVEPSVYWNNQLNSLEFRNLPINSNFLRITLFDVLGNQIFDRIETNITETFVVGIELKAGFYIARICTGRTILIVKIIVI